jgi:hypothetical protein
MMPYPEVFLSPSEENVLLFEELDETGGLVSISWEMWEKVHVSETTIMEGVDNHGGFSWMAAAARMAKQRAEDFVDALKNRIIVTSIHKNKVRSLCASIHCVSTVKQDILCF